MDFYKEKGLNTQSDCDNKGNEVAMTRKGYDTWSCRGNKGNRDSQNDCDNKSSHNTKIAVTTKAIVTYKYVATTK